MDREKLKSRRLELGYTLQDVADKMNLTRATIQKYESGLIKGVETTTLEKLAKVLQTTPAYLMGWEDEWLSDNSPDESFYDYYTKVRKSKGAVMFRGGDSDSDPFYMSAEEAADAEAYIRTRRKMQEEQGK